MDKTEKKQVVNEVRKAYEVERADFSRQFRQFAQRASERMEAYAAIQRQLELLQQQAKADAKQIGEMCSSAAEGEFWRHQESVCEIMTAEPNDGYGRYAAMLRFFQDRRSLVQGAGCRIEEAEEAARKALKAAEAAEEASGDVELMIQRLIESNNL